MSADILSRLQFAFTIGYHILWPTLRSARPRSSPGSAFSFGLTDKPVYRDLLRFWRRLFALGFGMGVITGIVLSYEIGTNWAAFPARLAMSSVLC